MIGLGTIVNTASVLAGGLLGSFAKDGLPERYKNTIIQGIGLSGNYTTLYAKSILDGVSAVVFSSTMGVGVVFAAIPVLVYQGSITLLAVYIQPYLTPEVINQMSLVGSVLIAGIGFNILEIKRFKVGNLLPSLFIPLFYSILQRMF